MQSFKYQGQIDILKHNSYSFKIIVSSQNKCQNTIKLQTVNETVI